MNIILTQIKLRSSTKTLFCSSCYQFSFSRIEATGSVHTASLPCSKCLTTFSILLYFLPLQGLCTRVRICATRGHYNDSLSTQIDRNSPSGAHQVTSNSRFPLHTITNAHTYHGHRFFHCLPDDVIMYVNTLVLFAFGPTSTQFELQT